MVREFYRTSGPAADGVVDGQEQLINPSALLFSSHRETTGVYLHTGEFFVSVVDLEIQGRVRPGERIRS